MQRQVSEVATRVNAARMSRARASRDSVGVRVCGVCFDDTLVYTCKAPSIEKYSLQRLLSPSTCAMSARVLHSMLDESRAHAVDAWQSACIMS